MARKFDLDQLIRDQAAAISNQADAIAYDAVVSGNTVAQAKRILENAQALLAWAEQQAKDK